MNQNLPQNVTSRYVSNLLNRGRNDTFEMITLTQEKATHDNITVGYYYDVTITKPIPDHTSEQASGVTPSQAISRCLRKFGVSFR
jgi:hypothetical protein